MLRTPRHLLSALHAITGQPGVDAAASRDFAATGLQHVRQLFGHRNVIGVGISERTAGDETTGELALCFYVRKKTSLRQLRGDQVIPALFGVAGGRACVTDVKEIGDCRPHVSVVGSGRLRSGVSVSHIADGAGTLGAIVRRAGKLCILSNAHVLARSGKARMGDPIVSPGSTDGGLVPADQVARLAAFVAFSKDGDNQVDAAVAELLPARAAEVDPLIPGAALPVRTALPQRGMMVAKIGRSTQETTGHVIDTHFRVTLPYPNGMGLLRFVDQILCTPFADPGDSGALVTDRDSGRVIGLHFAGSPNASICNPIGPVLTQLGISFAN